MLFIFNGFRVFDAVISSCVAISAGFSFGRCRFLNCLKRNGVVYLMLLFQIIDGTEKILFLFMKECYDKFY
jgi:ABC-type maltose transport system permease subunit